MKFNSETQRMEHPQAKMIPTRMWRELFKNEITETEIMLLQTDLAQDQKVISDVIQDLSPNQKLRAGICILLGHSECSDILIQNAETLTLLPDDLINIAVVSNRNDMISTIVEQYPNVKNWLGAPFIKASEVGNINALEKLAAYSPENVYAMIEHQKYRAFVNAAKNNQLPSIAWLMQKLSSSERQYLLKAIGSVAFAAAAANGHIPVMEWLLNQLTDAADRSKIINGDDYEAFNYAAENGHLDAMNWITEHSSPDDRHEMLTQEQSAAVYDAAKNGHLHIISRILEQLNANEQQKLIKSGGYYHSFESAAESGHRYILDSLITQLILNRKEKQVFKYKLIDMFENSAEGGHLEVMQWVLEQLNNAEERQKLLGMSRAFKWAAKNGHLHVLKWYLEQTYIDKPEKDDFSTAFSMAAGNGHLPVMKWLLNQLEESSKQQVIIGAFYEASIHERLLTMQWLVEQLNQLHDKGNTSNLFVNAFQSAHRLPTIKWFMEQVDSETRVKMIKKDGYRVFQNAARNGQLSVLKWLMQQLSDPNDQLAMIRANQYGAFCQAGYGQLPTMQWLMKQLNDPMEQQAMIQAGNYKAGQHACWGGGFLAVIEWLMEQLPDNGQAMIKYNDYNLYKGAVRDGHLPIIKLFLEHSDEQAQPRMVKDAYKAATARTNNKAETDYLLSFPNLVADIRENIRIYEEHTQEYGKRYVPLFVNKELDSLRSQKLRVEAENVHAVFNVDANQARVCFYMLRNLIRQNSDILQDDILFLLDIPAVKELVLTEVTQGRPNELLRLALSINNRNAADILLGIPAIRELAATHNFYRNEMRGQLDLRELARDRESSMRALSKVERKRLDKALERYQPMMIEQGVESLFLKLQEELAARYSKNPANVATSDGRIIELPLIWSDWKELSQTLSADTRERALQAYYQNKDHSAWRYLSKPNSWMFVDAEGYYAEYVSYNSRGAWSTFDQYKPEITMFWLAARDQGIPPIDEFTFETRMDHFVDELAHLGRAHNWDQPRIKMNDDGNPVLDQNGNIITEEYDDLEGDKPSCYSGVKRRLFQSVLGHPLLKLLTMETIKQELREFVRGYFNQIITDNNRDEIRDAWDTLCMANPLSDLQKDSLTKLNIPQENQIDFVKYLTQKYPGQFDDGVDALEFRSYVAESFKPTKVFEWHAVRFATETGLDTLLAERLSLESIRKAKSRLSHCGDVGTAIMNELNCLQRGINSTWSSIWVGSEEKLTGIIAALNSLPNEKYDEDFISILTDQESTLFQALFKPLSADTQPADAKFLEEIKEHINQFGRQARL